MIKNKSFSFFIVGAPKCGTTALAEHISSHPDVHIPAIKEPHFFCTDFEKYRRIKTLTAYQNLADAAPHGTSLVGEASVWYLYSKVACKKIHEYNPNAKIIIMIRDPATMLPSLHGQLLFSGREDIEDFQTAYNSSACRRKNQKVPTNSIEPSHLYYDQICRYHEQISRYYELFDPENIKIIVYEEFFEALDSGIRDILQFLKLSQNMRIQTKKINPARRHRFPALSHFIMRPPNELAHLKASLRRFLPPKYASPIRAVYSALSTPNKQRPPPRNLINQITSNYSEDKSRLQSLLGRDINTWTQ